MSVLFFLKHFCKVLYTCTLRKVKEKNSDMPFSKHVTDLYLSYPCLFVFPSEHREVYISLWM